jgi:hypothetical protein
MKVADMVGSYIEPDAIIFRCRKELISRAIRKSAVKGGNRFINTPLSQELTTIDAQRVGQTKSGGTALRTLRHMIMSCSPRTASPRFLRRIELLFKNFGNCTRPFLDKRRVVIGRDSELVGIENEMCGERRGYPSI